MKKEKEINNEVSCDMCEIVLPYVNCRILQYAPIGNNMLLIIIYNDLENKIFSYISSYLRSKKYIFREKQSQRICLEHNWEFYGC